jgi:hypothetical protein
MIIARAPVENGTILAQFETKQREVNVQGKVAVAVVLKEVGAAKNEPAIPLLTQLSGHVRSIIESFRPEFA